MGLLDSAGFLSWNQVLDQLITTKIHKKKQQLYTITHSLFNQCINIKTNVVHNQNSMFIII